MSRVVFSRYTDTSFFIKRITTFAFIIIILFLPLTSVFAYDDQTTHPALTQEVVDFYNDGGGIDRWGNKTKILKPLNLTKEEKEAEKTRKDIEKQKEKEINELRKQGYTDELIAVIIPTINNGQ